MTSLLNFRGDPTIPYFPLKYYVTPPPGMWRSGALYIIIGPIYPTAIGSPYIKVLKGHRKANFKLVLIKSLNFSTIRQCICYLK